MVFVAATCDWNGEGGPSPHLARVWRAQEFKVSVGPLELTQVKKSQVTRLDSHAGAHQKFCRANLSRR